MKLGNRKEEDYNEDIGYEEQYDNDQYDEQYDTQDERELRYERYQERKQNFADKVRNPFGIQEKLNSIDEQINYGSSRTKLIFILVSLGGIVIIAIILLLLLQLF